MQTNRSYFESLTVPALKDILTDFKAVGFSKMRKAELVNFILPLFDGAHLDAIAYAEQQADSIDAEYAYRKTLSNGRKGYTERMLNRIHGYYTQNSCERLTPKQARRFNKKYNRQYANLLASL